MKKQFFLWALLLSCTLPTFAHDFKVYGIYYKKLGGDSVAVTYQGRFGSEYKGEYSGSVTIPETVYNSGTTYRVTSIDESAFYQCPNLTSITIPNSITSIGLGAFCGCYALTTITIPNSVTSIGNAAFFECTGLHTITIPNCVTSINERTFEDCSNLTSVTIGNGVLSIGNSAFESCSSLTNITIPNSVTSIGTWAFRGCSNLTAITIPNSVTTIGYLAFASCPCLESIFVETDNPTYHSANNCLIKTNDKALIAGCKNSIIPTDGSVTIIFGAFSGCYSLTSISIPYSVRTLLNNSFTSCTGLTEIICKAVTPPEIGDYRVFGDVDKTIPLYVPIESVEAYKTADHWDEFTNIQGVDFPTGIENLTSNDVITSKVLENGIIYIIRNGERYSVDGRKVE